jgi:hypothetical protein
MRPGIWHVSLPRNISVSEVELAGPAWPVWPVSGISQAL